MHERNINTIDLSRIALFDPRMLVDAVALDDGAVGAAGTLVAFAPAELVVASALYLRFHITLQTSGRTRDKLQWAPASTGPWSDLVDGGKVIIAEFDRTADTRVVLRGVAYVVDDVNETAGGQNVKLTVPDWELNRARQPDWTGNLGQDLTITTGSFVFPASGEVTAFHEVNFNASAVYNNMSFFFDPLVIIVPKRPLISP